jgi:hypothetical protein
MIEINEASPPQGLSEAWRGKEVFSIHLPVFFPSLIRRGAPFGAAEFIVSGGMGVSTPIKSDRGIFHVRFIF